MAKIYTKNTWTDEELADDALYDILESDDTPINEDVQIVLTTDVIAAGTGVTAERMNNIEEGIDAIDTKLADALDLLTTGGTSTAYTITTVGDANLATGETFRVKFHATAGATPTLNRDAKGAKDLKYYDSTGAKQAATAAQIIADMILTIIYDGVDYVLLGGAPSTAITPYRIAVSVASNNLTVALKDKDGNDPSPSSPVRVQIGDTVRTITSALSVTKNAGTNWCNSGSAELATKEIDYFAYLGYNATDGVVIGFSRIPYATNYSNFSATTTNERYCAISTITNAAASDAYVVIGRFAATLSAGAGYTWSVPTFTPANLIHQPIYATRILNFATQITYLGGTTDPTSNTPSTQMYFINNRTMTIQVVSALVCGAGNRSITNFSGPWNTYAVTTSPFNGVESITAVGPRSTNAYMTGNLLIFYNSIMANNGSYFAYAQNTLP